MAYASTAEPLRAANRLSGRELYRWSHIAIEGSSSRASSGIDIAADHRVGTDAPFDYVIVCAGGDPAAFHHAPTFAWLRQLARRGVRLGGVSGGAYVLARANVLTGYRVTLHWEHAPGFREDYPGLDLRRSLFEIDRDRMTCGGGTAPLDMMHAMIAREHGSELALSVSEWFLQTHVREGGVPQRMPLRERLNIAHGPLLSVLERMEAALEHPLPRAELAREANLSVRQLERLFRLHLGCTIGERYQRLRLDRARLLLRQTSLSVLETALACGFASASHFSRAYNRRFGHPPRSERIARTKASMASPAFDLAQR
ncbi:MAG: GlxA family transcriptional regulator [Beijerinckiaceae bacterium]|nr:GlxA family transcriptional regulator [Beijerinckiaceae bacterium]